MTRETTINLASLTAFVVISVAVTGYFVGLQSPMNPVDRAAKSLSGAEVHGLSTESPANSHDDSHPMERESAVVPSSHYSEMADVTRSRFSAMRTSLVGLKSNVDPLAEVNISPEQKAFALELREQNRAFNGAPPTVPHAVDQMTAQACVVCHTEGAKTETLRIPKMSHQFLASCNQCHVENSPQHMPAAVFRENSFVGLPAPTAGPRAFPLAPPQIPHTTWMRVDCMSCHGTTGLHGMRSTHPWRQNCQQCHAPSSVLDQVLLDPIPNFLPPPNVKTNEE